MTEERRGEKYDNMGLPDLARALMDLQAQKDFLKEQGSDIQKDIDVLTMSIIPELMADQEIATITIDDVGRLQVKADAYVSVLASNRDEMHDWMRDNGHESMIKDTVHAGTLKAWTKAQVKSGEEYPQHLIRFEAYEKAVLVKS